MAVRLRLCRHLLPIWPPAPARFSMTMGWPSRAESGSASSRSIAPPKLAQEAVSRRIQQHRMEGHVGGSAVSIAIPRSAHAGEEGAHRHDVACRCTLRRQLCRLRLDHAAEVEQVGDEIGLDRRVRMPVQQLGIQDLPPVAGQHAGAGPRAASASSVGSTAPGGQSPDRMARPTASATWPCRFFNRAALPNGTLCNDFV